MTTEKKPIRSFRDLDVWKKSMDLVVSVYKLSSGFPASENYGLTAQLRRASVSVPSNIAEGHSRKSQREFARFLEIAGGSLSEVQTHLMLVERLGYSQAEQTQSLLASADEIAKMLHGLLRTVAHSRAPDH